MSELQANSLAVALIWITSLLLTWRFVSLDNQPSKVVFVPWRYSKAFFLGGGVQMLGVGNQLINPPDWIVARYDAFAVQAAAQILFGALLFAAIAFSRNRFLQRRAKPHETS